MAIVTKFDRQFYECLRIRLVEEALIALYPADKIQSPLHLSIGQEAVAVGVCSSLAPADLIFLTYRSHAFYLAKGGGLREMFAELFGKVTGCAKGKGGSMHLLSPEHGVYPASAIVASTIPNAVGAAFAAKMMANKKVVVSVFGDGAMEEGVFHESLNFAALKQLPVIFVLENNGLAIHSKISTRQAFDIRRLVESYNVPYFNVTEGFDFVRVSNAASDVVDLVKRGHGPVFMEVRTNRYREHVGISFDLEGDYRSRHDDEQWMSQDPLFIRKDLVEKLAPKIKVEIEDAIAFAEASPYPDATELLTDVT